MLIEFVDFDFVKDLSLICYFNDAQPMMLQIAHDKMTCRFLVRGNRSHPAASAQRPVWEEILSLIPPLESDESNPPATISHT